MRNSLSRYQSRLWVIIRNTLFVLGIYFSGLVSLELAFPLMLWFLFEASLRYFPRWLQISTLVFLGLQIDWWLQWPLGLGLGILTIFWSFLILGRAIKRTELFLVWQLSIFLLFLLLIRQFVPSLTSELLSLQLVGYFLFIMLRLFLGKRG